MKDMGKEAFAKLVHAKLSASVNENAHLKIGQVEMVMSAIDSVLVEAVKTHDGVRVCNTLRIAIEHRAPRNFKNPRTLEIQKTKAHTIARLRQSETLKKALSARAVTPTITPPDAPTTNGSVSDFE